MGSPAFFRAEDGTLGVVSSQNNATGAIYVWDGKGDGATFTNERAITVTDNSIVTNPRIVYDAASKGYKVFWTDGLSGEGRMATLSDLTAKATVGETLKADAVAMGVGDVTEGLPAWAGEGQTRAFAVSSSEFECVLQELCRSAKHRRQGSGRRNRGERRFRRGRHRSGFRNAGHNDLQRRLHEDLQRRLERR